MSPMSANACHVLQNILDVEISMFSVMVVALLDKIIMVAEIETDAASPEQTYMPTL